MTTKTPKMTGWMLFAALALSACNGAGPNAGDAGDGGLDAGDAGQDFCTQSVAVSQKLENELVVCELDAGLPTGIGTSAELAKCQQELDAGCDTQDQITLSTAATCIDELPPLQCAWFMTDGGVPLAALAWALAAYSCKPASLSPSCQIVTGIPLDAGLPF
jgi:hypothetical protein